MKNFNKNLSLSLIFMLLLNTFFTSVFAAQWQGYGNISASNLTDIWAYINHNIKSAISFDYKPFTTGFSDNLNTLWNPAWNVFVIKLAKDLDTIVYGYAFRNHWMWYNGFISGTAHLSFVIWKDYNCQVWITFQSTSTSSINKFTSAEQTILNQLKQEFSSDSTNDIWTVAKKFIDKLALKPNFVGSDKAFSIVLAQGYMPTISGTFCTAGEKYQYDTIMLAGDQFASYLVFQTRQD